MSDFLKLDVWEKSHALLLNVHGAVKNIRGADYVSLRNQMLRAGMSVPTNLVEGVGQKSAKEFARPLTWSQVPTLLSPLTALTQNASTTTPQLAQNRSG